MIMIKTMYAGKGLDGSINLTEYDGRYFPPNLQNLQKHAENLENFDFSEDDILICSYPKSGYHWVWEITTMLVQNRTDLTDKMASSFILDFAPLLQRKRLSSPRVYGLHSSFEFVPESFKRKKCKIINVIRDPRSVAVSAYHFYSKLKPAKLQGDWSGFLDLFINGKVPFNDWFTFTRSWENMRRSNVHGLPICVLCYEDLLKDPFSEIKRLARFLQVNPSDSFIRKVADSTLFSNMKAMKDKVQRGHFISSHFQNNDFVLYRKGDMNDWKSHFTLKQNEDFEQLFADRMKGYDLKLKSMISHIPEMTGCIEVRNRKSML